MGFFDDLFATAERAADTYVDVRTKLKPPKARFATPTAPEPSLSRGEVYAGPAAPAPQIALAGFGGMKGMAVLGVLVLLGILLGRK